MIQGSGLMAIGASMVRGSITHGTGNMKAEHTTRLFVLSLCMLLIRSGISRTRLTWKEEPDNDERRIGVYRCRWTGRALLYRELPAQVRAASAMVAMGGVGLFCGGGSHVLYSVCSIGTGYVSRMMRWRI